MNRGDVVIVAAAGDFGKPRPCVVVQSDALPTTHASVVICQMTSELVDAPEFRVLIVPSSLNGLRIPSQIMADKPTTVRRLRIGPRIGRLTAEEMRNLNTAIGFVFGFGD